MNNSRNDRKSHKETKPFSVRSMVASVTLSLCLSLLLLTLPLATAVAETDTGNVGCTVNEVTSLSTSSELTAPVDWGGTVVVSESVDYTNTTDTSMELTADIQSTDLPATAVSNLEVEIKKGTESDSNYVVLATGNGDGSTKTLLSGITDSSGTISVDFKLDATSVPADESNLGVLVPYTITFTLS